MKVILYFFTFIFFLNSCGSSDPSLTSPSDEKESSLVAEIETSNQEILERDPIWYNNNDTLFNYCRAIIESNYRKQHPDTKFTLEEIDIYRDDLLCIVSFNEIQETGSWTYTNSSMVFLKDDLDLISLKLIPETLSENDPFHFPNRINGKFLNRTDINLNGRPEFLFEFSTSYRTNYSSIHSFYEMDQELHVLYPIEMSATTEGLVGECEDFIGQKRRIEILDQNPGVPPIIVIYTTNTRCKEDGTTEIIDEYRVNFQWDKEDEVFHQV